MSFEEAAEIYLEYCRKYSLVPQEPSREKSRLVDDLWWMLRTEHSFIERVSMKTSRVF